MAPMNLHFLSEGPCHFNFLPLHHSALPGKQRRGCVLPEEQNSNLSSFFMKVHTDFLSLLLLLLLLLLLQSAVMKSCRLIKGCDSDSQFLPFALTSLNYSYLQKPSWDSWMILVYRAHWQSMKWQIRNQCRESKCLLHHSGERSTVFLVWALYSLKSNPLKKLLK